MYIKLWKIFTFNFEVFKWVIYPIQWYYNTILKFCLNQDVVEKPEYTVIVEKLSADEDFFSSATEATNPGKFKGAYINRQSPIFFIAY